MPYNERARRVVAVDFSGAPPFLANARPGSRELENGEVARPFDALPNLRFASTFETSLAASEFSVETIVVGDVSRYFDDVENQGGATR